MGAITDGVEAWIDLGEPKITDYHVELINPAASGDTEPQGYIDKRPHATLKFSLIDDFK